jgi:hypothetical protein
MFEDAVRDLAAITHALDIDPEESGGAGPILHAVALLKRKQANAGEEAMQRAAAELPIGYVMRICLEKDSGSVEIDDAEGNELTLETDTDSMTTRIIESINIAIAHADAASGAAT